MSKISIQSLDKEELEKHFYYDESSPSCLRWKVNIMCGRNNSTIRVRKGVVAGNLNKVTGYWGVCFRGLRLKVHRVIYTLLIGEIPTGYPVDHLDRDRANNNINNLKPKPRQENNRNTKKYKNNTSGVVGVRLQTNKLKNGVRQYWVARWQDLQGGFCQKFFSINKHGAEEAFQLACVYRIKMIEELNKQGAGYTTDHGT